MFVKVIAEIEGYAVALTNTADTTDLTWATSVLPVIKSIPNPSPLSANFLTGESDAGGFSIETTDISGLLDDLNVSEVTTLDGDQNEVASTISVVSASSLSSSGVVWVGSEAIAYSGKSGNDLTGCTRGYYGTTATSHFDGDFVFSSPTGLWGKRIFLKWKTQGNNSWVRSIGVIDSVEFVDGGYRLVATSPQVLFREGLVMEKGYLKMKGRIVGRNSTEEVLLLRVEGSKEETQSFVSRIQATNSRYGVMLKSNDLHFSIGKRITYPAFDKELTSYSGKLATWNLLEPADGVLEADDLVEIVDSSATVEVSDLYVNKKPLGIGYAYLTGDDSSYSFTTGDRLQTPTKIGCFVPSGGSKIKSLGEDQDLEEIRFIRGNFITDILLPLVTSTGTGVNGDYDILPEGWGLGFASAYVDFDTLEVLAPIFAQNRTYFFDSAISLWEVMVSAGACVGVLFFFNTNGVLTAKKTSDLFPDDEAILSVNRDRLLDKSIPSLTTGYSEIINSVTFDTDYDPVKKQFRNQIIARDVSSISRYNRRVHQISDKGLVKSLGLPSLGLKILRFYSLPYPVITCRIRYEYGDSFTIGDFIQLEVPHLPDMMGSKGIDGTLFRLEGITFNDSEGSFELRLRGLNTVRTGLIAPSGLVHSKTTSEIVLKSSSTTLFSPANPHHSTTPIHENDGAEDSDWFYAGDKVTLWDLSTLGGTPTTSDHTVVSVDYATRTLEVSPNVPAWVASGDLVRFTPAFGWSGATTLSDRKDVFVAFATILLAGFDPYIWGV